MLVPIISLRNKIKYIDRYTEPGRVRGRCYSMLVPIIYLSNKIKNIGIYVENLNVGVT